MSPFASSSSFCGIPAERGYLVAGYLSKSMFCNKAKQYPGCCMRIELGLLLAAESRFAARPRVLLTFLMEIHSEMWFGAGACNLERNFSAVSVFREERINRLQQNGFPTGRHLRQLCLHLC